MRRFVVRTLFVLVILPGSAAAQTPTVHSPGSKDEQGFGRCEARERVESAAQSCARFGGASHEAQERFRFDPNGMDFQVQARPHRDSLWNGVLIGAALGTIAGIGASFAIADCDGCAGFNVPLTFGVLGGGIGVGLGAAIDALHQEKPVTGLGSGRVRVSPVLSPGKRGLVASVLF